LKQAPTDAEILLTSDEDEVAVIPSLGGALGHWKVRGAAVLRPRTGGSRDPTDMACFVMAPFSNIISGGKLRFRNDVYSLPPNHPNEPLPTHGDAWLCAWNVSQTTRDQATICYHHDGLRGFPFRYRVVQGIRVGKASLSLSLLMQNTDHRSMPAGLGFHPYFCKSRNATLSAPHAGLWLGREIQPDTRFLRDDRLDECVIDDCFAGWRRTAYLTLPEEQRRIIVNASSTATALVVYSPLGADFICIEPVTHVNDGINCMADGVEATGVQVLEPGASMRLDVDLRVAALDAPVYSNEH
jgi:aldose 1-epimerase